ncbi:MAG: hypothetical protein ACI4Q4_03565 [Oscillospiraceae bacterium]
MIDKCIYDSYEQCFHECEDCPQYRGSDEDDGGFYPYDTLEEAYD